MIERDVEPVRDVDVADLATRDGAEEHDAEAIHATAIAMSNGHSSSAYSFDVFQPASSDQPPSRIVACHA